MEERLSNLFGNLAANDPPIKNIQVVLSYDIDIEINFYNGVDSRNECFGIEDFQANQGRIVEHLMNLPTLETLGIFSWESDSLVLSDDGIDGIITGMSRLIRLTFERITFPAGGERRFFDALAHNTTIKELEFEKVEFSSETTFMDMGAVLVINKTLAKLIIHDVDMTELDVRSLTSGLLSNTTLKKLGLDRNQIDNNGVKILTDILATNPSLEILHLWYDEYDFDVVPLFTECLKTNSNLTELSITSYSITPTQAGYLTDLLRSNPSGLKTLDFMQSIFQLGAMEIFAAGVAANTTLTTLDLKWCEFDETQLGFLEAAMAVNTTITKLSREKHRYRPLNAAIEGYLVRNNAIETNWRPDLSYHLYAACSEL